MYPAAPRAENPNEIYTAYQNRQIVVTYDILEIQNDGPIGVSGCPFWIFHQCPPVAKPQKWDPTKQVTVCPLENLKDAQKRQIYHAISQMGMKPCQCPLKSLVFAELDNTVTESVKAKIGK